MTATQPIQNLSGFRDLWIEGADTPPVRHVSVTKAENAHEKASLYIPNRSQDFTSMLGARCMFTYGNFTNRMSFAGYVAEIIPQRSLGDTSTYSSEQEVIVFGPTMVLKGNKPRFLTDVTVPEAIRSVVTDNGLGFSDESRGEIKSNAAVWRSLAQTCETDWETIVHWADRIGCHVLSQRGVVRLLDYNDIAFRKLPTHFLRMRSQLPVMDTLDSNEGTIINYVPVSISTIDPTYRTPSLAYLEGGQAVYVPASGRQGPVPRRFATDMPVHTKTEAEALQGGYYYPRWNQQAEVTSGGDPTIEPSAIIDIDSGARSKASLAPEFDGIWYVNSVTHRITGQSFASQMNLGRPVYRASNWYQDRPFWHGDRRGVPTLITAGDGTWLSTWR